MSQAGFMRFGCFILLLAAARPLLAASPMPPAATSGPPTRSILNEAHAAIHRANRWLEAHPAPEPLPDPADHWAGQTLQTPEDIALLLPLLEGHIPPHLPDLFYAYAALALALDQIGHETIFLDATRPVAWREALLHQLVQTQRIDPQGRGFWGVGDDPAALARATAYALRALAITGASPP
ncbi:MAG: hypothetical protein GX803_01955 [Lentisphaerae bacterium]|jgi:hypothetical protein|nr:hypothetical protein [Lentisphaerota bacterium]